MNLFPVVALALRPLCGAIPNAINCDTECFIIVVAVGAVALVEARCPKSEASRTFSFGPSLRLICSHQRTVEACSYNGNSERPATLSVSLDFRGIRSRRRYD